MSASDSNTVEIIRLAKLEEAILWAKMTHPMQREAISVSAQVEWMDKRLAALSRMG